MQRRPNVMAVDSRSARQPEAVQVVIITIILKLLGKTVLHLAEVKHATKCRIIAG